MKIPSKIKIGNLIYTIGELVDSNSTDFGKSSHDQQWIRLTTKFTSEDKKGETFLHEIMHQILDQGHYDSTDEKLIDYIARTLYQILKENKIF